MDWIIKYPERFIRECAELDQLVAEVDWLSTSLKVGPEGDVEIHLNMMVHGKIYEGRMNYPFVFPNAPPYIRPLNPEERWSVHQFGVGGSLCLEWRTDNWNPEVTGADIIRSAYKLLSTEKAPENPGIVPSTHRVTDGQSTRNKLYRSITTTDLVTKILELPQQQKVALKTRLILHPTSLVTYITDLLISEESNCAITDLPNGITGFSSVSCWKGEGWLFKSEQFTTKRTFSSIDDLLVLISEAGFSVDGVAVKDETTGKYSERVLVLLGKEIESLRIFSIETYGDQPLKEHKVILPSRLTNRLPEESKSLSQLKIGIVGLGSIGSKVALSLAKSGMRKFLLVDDDYLVPENLVRHELSWGFAGMHKVHAVQEALNLMAPNLEIEVLNHRIAGQEPPVNAASALQDLSQCDMLIDATANPEVFLNLSAIAKANKIALCWGEVFPGGYGGLIARARPDIDPNPISVRDSLYAYLERKPPPPYKQATGYDIETEEPAIAYDSNVGLIASALTSLAIDTALMRKPSYYPCPLYLIGMRQEWFFTQPFDTYPINASGEGWDAATPSSDEAKREAILLLMKKLEKEK